MHWGLDTGRMRLPCSGIAVPRGCYHTAPSSAEQQEAWSRAQMKPQQTPHKGLPPSHPSLAKGTHHLVLLNKERSGPQSTCFYGYGSMASKGL